MRIVAWVPQARPQKRPIKTHNNEVLGTLLMLLRFRTISRCKLRTHDFMMNVQAANKLKIYAYTLEAGPDTFLFGSGPST